MDMLLYLSPYLYGTYVTTDRKGTNQLINQCMNSVYVTMVEILLYYCKFCKTMKLNKFEMNPYDTCVTNLLVNGLQQSTLFHVDDCKLSHKHPKVNDSFIGVLHKEYLRIFEDGFGILQVNHGKVYKYLGVTLDFTTVDQVNITMLDYIN